ncbi:MAG TPA: DHA2 family efflux MFS transporter permease subunit [Candidatus Binataceae bacterium]|nr:DHA2 family efflux MFS transporter permease subunit [Candidatus Binataceae bacterium]
MAAGLTHSEDLVAARRTAESGKWIVALSVLLGTFVALMDVTIVNVAMPHMMGSFGIDLLTVTWVATSYNIASMIMITMAAWWTTLIGRKRLYLFSMIVFVAGSVLSGMSHTLAQMIAFRILQGIGGGTLMPLSQAIVREKFPPEEQGVAMATFSMGTILAPATGPVIAGWLIDNYGWPFIFYINVPICLICLFMVSTFVHDPPYLKRGVEKIDAVGIGLLTAGITALQIVLERGQQVGWFQSRMLTWGVIFTASALLSLVVWELLQKEPIINLRLYKNPLLRAGNTYNAVTGFAVFGSTFLLPQLTQTLLGYTALASGLVMIPRSIMMLFFMQVSGRMYNRVSPRKLVTFAMIVLIYTYWSLGHLSTGVGFWNIALLTASTGLGLAFSGTVVNTVALSSVARQNMTQAAALSNFVNRVAGNVAYAVLATVVTRRAHFHRSILVDNITPRHEAFIAWSPAVQRVLRVPAFNSGSAQETAVSVVNHVVTREARMLAYNDVHCMLAIIMLIFLPIVFLLPSKGIPDETEEVIE